MSSFYAIIKRVNRFMLKIIVSIALILFICKKNLTMDATHLHLLFNHVGIMGILFATILLLVAVFLRSDILKRTAMVGFVIATIATGITMNTGEGAEESVEHMPGITASNIHDHEEAAEVTVWVVAVCGLWSLIGLVFYLLSKPLPSMFSVVLVLVAIVAAAMIFNTGRLGGLIRHTELSGTTVAASPTNANGAEQGHENHD